MLLFIGMFYSACSKFCPAKNKNEEISLASSSYSAGTVFITASISEADVSFVTSWQWPTIMYICMYMYVCMS